MHWCRVLGRRGLRNISTISRQRASHTAVDKHDNGKSVLHKHVVEIRDGDGDEGMLTVRALPM